MQWWVWVPHCGMILCQAGSLVLSLGVISLMLGNPLPPSTPSATTFPIFIYLHIISFYFATTFSYYIFIFSCYIFSFPTNFLNLLVFFIFVDISFRDISQPDFCKKVDKGVFFLDNVCILHAQHSKDK